MSEKKKELLVPDLRFPAFENLAPWNFRPLKEVADRVLTRNLDGKVTSVLTNSATAGVVYQRDYFERDIVTTDNLTNYYVVEEGDFVYNPRISVTAPVGPISKNKLGRGVMSPLYTIFRFTKKGNGFYEQYFKTSYWHEYLRSVSNEGARHDRMNISIDDFMNLPVPCPILSEKEAVEQCLSALDDLIEHETNKLETLKNHKKGLLQGLFTTNQ